MRKPILLLLPVLVFLAFSCKSGSETKGLRHNIIADTPFLQDHSVKYYFTDAGIKPVKVVSDRNGYIQILTTAGLFRPAAGDMLFPGTLVRDVHYRPVSDKSISGIGIYDEQIVYLDNKAVLSNARAGELYTLHNMPGADIFAVGDDFSYLVSDGTRLDYVKGQGNILEITQINEPVIDIKFDKTDRTFWILGKSSVSSLNSLSDRVDVVISNKDLTSFELTDDRIIAGTSKGYIEIDKRTRKQVGEIHSFMPDPEITVIREIDGKLWFGSVSGAMMLREDGKFSYYASERWLPGDTVTDITKGPGNSVLVLTGRGLAKICFSNMTLYEKAEFFGKQVRERHIRNGFNATLSSMKNGDVSTGSLEDSDNDGLWTSMYLAAEAFRYAVTGEEDAMKNIRESLGAMERLYTINPVPGFPSRSFERRGYKYDDPAWRRADHPEWDWKSTTSSDEAIGHIFAFGVIAELIAEHEVRDKAIELIDTLMSHILTNDFYLKDWDGKPTRWGRWNPEYVNSFPEMIGDRKLNSSNITGMLQTAYHFTGKEKYRDAAFYLLREHGYLENLIRPMKEIGIAPGDSDDLSRLLSEGWNHSDDEMYYCGYWGLYRYAFNDTLKEKYRVAILDHWEAERPEKDGLWNIMTALTGVTDFDAEEALWYLREYPLDLRDWTVKNSHRKDIELLNISFRNQFTKEVLPPDELSISRHNSNRFIPDGGSGGSSEYSAGDIWLLPYWMGRFLGIIGGPEEEK